jgi:hypothetical protein
MSNAIENCALMFKNWSDRPARILASARQLDGNRR